MPVAILNNNVKNVVYSDGIGNLIWQYPAMVLLGTTVIVPPTLTITQQPQYELVSSCAPGQQSALFVCGATRTPASLPLTFEWRAGNATGPIMTGATNSSPTVSNIVLTCSQIRAAQLAAGIPVSGFLDGANLVCVVRAILADQVVAMVVSDVGGFAVTNV